MWVRFTENEREISLREEFYSENFIELMRVRKLDEEFISFSFWLRRYQDYWTPKKNNQIMLLFLLLSVGLYASILFCLFMFFSSSGAFVIDNYERKEVLYDGFSFLVKCLKLGSDFEEEGLYCFWYVEVNFFYYKLSIFLTTFSLK